MLNSDMKVEKGYIFNNLNDRCDKFFLIYKAEIKN